MVADGQVTLATFTDQAVRRHDLQTLATKVVAVTPPTARADQDPGGQSVTVQIVTTDATATAEVHEAAGSPRRPLAEDQVVAKFVACAATHFDPDAATAIAHEVLAFEQVDDVAGWLAGRRLTGPRSSD
jgi:2-methylcitrate dehydratase PrpD